MKTKSIALFLMMGFTSTLYAQIQTPVKWAYGKKKIGPDTYEIHLKATIQDGWHLYAQKQPDNAVAVPTKFKFDNNGQFTLVGKVKELGKLEEFEDPSTGIGANQYTGSVDFVQVVKVKSSSVTAINVTVTYQTCTDQMCLPATKRKKVQQLNAKLAPGCHPFLL